MPAVNGELKLPISISRQTSPLANAPSVFYSARMPRLCFKLALPFLICAAAMAGDARPWPALDVALTEKVRADVSAKVTAKFEILISGPWILVTDFDSRTAKTILNEVVNGAAVRVREQLFPRAKYTRPVVIYLLKDTTSYMSWSHRLFQELPPTAQGYYDRREGYIFTQADGGFGPLLHEMVHVMAEADYPGIPAWLNEGLGSLFEEYEQDSDGIAGVNNWRLTRFKQEILAKRPVPLRTLFALDYKSVYGPNSLSYYATARHLMLWLQEQNKVLDFYAALRDSKNADPVQSLLSVFGKQKSLEQIESELQQWALVQRFSTGRSGPSTRKTSDRFR